MESLYTDSKFTISTLVQEALAPLCHLAGSWHSLVFFQAMFQRKSSGEYVFPIQSGQGPSRVQPDAGQRSAVNQDQLWDALHLSLVCFPKLEVNFSTQPPPALM